jgi:hypothetical protein
MNEPTIDTRTPALMRAGEDISSPLSFFSSPPTHVSFALAHSSFLSSSIRYLHFIRSRIDLYRLGLPPLVSLFLSRPAPLYVMLACSPLYSLPLASVPSLFASSLAPHLSRSSIRYLLNMSTHLLHTTQRASTMHSTRALVLTRMRYSTCMCLPSCSVENVSPPPLLPFLSLCFSLLLSFPLHACCALGLDSRPPSPDRPTLVPHS